MSHETYADSVLRIAAGSWGKEAKSESEFDRILIDSPDKLQAWAAITLIQGLQKFANSFVPQKEPDAIGPPGEDDPVFPSAKVGDIFWYGDDIEGGLMKQVVIGKDDEGHVLLCRKSKVGMYIRSLVSWAGVNDFPDQSQAFRKMAITDIEYHQPRLKAAQRVIADLESGADLTKYIEGIDLDEYRDEPDADRTEDANG